MLRLDGCSIIHLIRFHFDRLRSVVLVVNDGEIVVMRLYNLRVVLVVVSSVAISHPALVLVQMNRVEADTSNRLN
jgi:hypothetical protein